MFASESGRWGRGTMLELFGCCLCSVVSRLYLKKRTESTQEGQKLTKSSRVRRGYLRSKARTRPSIRLLLQLITSADLSHAISDPLLQPVRPTSDTSEVLEGPGEDQLITTAAKDLLEDGAAYKIRSEQLTLIPLEMVGMVGNKRGLCPVGMHNGGVNIGSIVPVAELLGETCRNCKLRWKFDGNVGTYPHGRPEHQTWWQHSR